MNLNSTASYKKDCMPPFEHIFVTLFRLTIQVLNFLNFLSCPLICRTEFFHLRSSNGNGGQDGGEAVVRALSLGRVEEEGC